MKTDEVLRSGDDVGISILGRDWGILYDGPTLTTVSKSERGKHQNYGMFGENV